MKIRFLIPGLPLPLRALIFSGLELGGLYYQFYLAEDVFSLNFLLSLGIMILGVLFLTAKNYQNKPQDLGFEDWQPVTVNEFNRIKENLLKTQKSGLPLYYRKGAGAALIIILVLILFVSGFFEIFFLIPLAIDGVIILWPLFFSGLIKLWTPSDLKLKIPRFEVILNKAQDTDKNLIITPYLRFDKDKEGRKIPEDIRFMLEPRRKPEDFIGVQLQAAINNGPNGAVPYLYAVFLCKGQGKTFLKLKDMDYQSFISEAGGDKEYGFIVVRQKTGGTGYHTTEGDCLRLYGLIRQILKELPQK
jgi:hypothetical protein